MKTLMQSIIPAPQGSALQPPALVKHEHLWALSLYGILTIFFHGAQDLLHHLVGAGDAYIATIASLLFTAKLSPWNPYVQLGQYAFANIHFQSFYPPNLILLSIFPNTFGYNLFILAHYVAAGYFFYLFARLFMTLYPALFAGFVFMAGGFMGAHKGHASMLSAAVWLPLILYFVERHSITGRIKYLAFAGVAAGLCIIAGFPQISLYTSIVTLAYLGYRLLALRWSGGRSVGRFASAAGLLFAIAALIGSIQLLPLMHAFPLITREKLTFELFTQDSMPVYHLLGLFVPNLVGGLFSISTYSPEFNFVEAYPYSGLIPLVFVFVAIAAYRKERREVVFWTALCVVAFLFAFGSQTPLYQLLFHVPVYNLFRASARHLFEVDFALAILAGFGLDFFVNRTRPLSRKEWRRVRMALVWFAAIFAGTLVVAAVVRLGAQVLQYVDPKKLENIYVNSFHTLRAARELMVKNLDPSSPTIYLPCLFFVLIVVIFSLLRTKYHLMAAALVFPLSVADIYLNYRTMYPAPDTRDLFDEKARSEMVFLNGQGFDRGLYRTFPADTAVSQPYPLLNMMYGVSTINDYTPFWMKRYHSLTNFQFNGWMPLYGFQDCNLFAVTGAKYLMASEPAVQQSIEGAVAPASQSALSAIPLPPWAGGWKVDGDISFDGSTAHLKSGSPGGVGLIQTEFPIKRDATYVLRFEARSAEPETLFMVDFYGENYDLSAQDRTIPNLFSEFRRYEISIPSGGSVPQHAFLRLYVVGRGNVDIRGLYFALGEAAQPAYRHVFTTADKMKIYENPMALPRFRFVRRIVAGRTFEQVRAAVEDPGLDVRNAAVVEGIDSEMNVDPGRILRYQIANNHLEWQLESGHRSFFVVGDTYFPGWKAYVDGKEVPIYAVDGIVRGIFVEGAGQHQVSMRFRPWSLYAGIGSASLGLCLAFIVYWRDRRYYQPAPQLLD